MPRSGISGHLEPISGTRRDATGHRYGVSYGVKLSPPSLLRASLPPDVRYDRMLWIRHWPQAASFA